MEGRGRSRRRSLRKGWRQRLSSWTAVMLVTAMICNMPLSWGGLAFGISNGYASASNAEKREDGLWATAANATYKPGKSNPVDIYVLAEDNEVTTGSITCLTLYLKNNTNQEIVNGVLKYKGKFIEDGDGIFTDLHETLSDSCQNVEENPSGKTFVEEVTEIETENRENTEFIGEVSDEDEGIELTEKVNTDELDEEDTEEGEEDDKELHVLTDICLEPGKLYEVLFEFETQEEESKKANVSFHFSGEGLEDGKKLYGNEKFYYGINLPFIQIELNHGNKLEKTGSHEMNIWMAEPSWVESEEEIDVKIEHPVVKEEVKEETEKPASPSDAEASPSDAQNKEADAADQDKEAESVNEEKKAEEIKEVQEQEKIKKYAGEAMAIKDSKISYEVEIFGTSYKKFSPQKAKNVENAGWISCLYEFAEDAVPGVYYGKVLASGKWNRKGFVSEQGFLFEIIRPETIELHAELDGMEVMVSGKAEFFPEADRLEVQIEKANEEQEQKAIKVLEQKAEEGKDIPCYQLVNLRLLADGEEVEALEPLDVSFKNMKLVRTQESEEELDVYSVETEGEAAAQKKTNEEIAEGNLEEYSIAELQEMETEGRIEIYRLNEEENTADLVDSDADKNGEVSIKTKQFSAFFTVFAMNDEGIMTLEINPDDIPEVEGVSIPGVNITMFNYDDSVNKMGLGDSLAESNGYHFYQGKLNNSVMPHKDKSGGKSTLSPVMLPTLDRNGYPQIKNGPPAGTKAGSMDYLFKDEEKTFKKGVTMTDGGGLFQRDSDGYYYYNSDKNAAYFDSSKSKFTLYDGSVCPYYMKDFDYWFRNFLPFNNPKTEIVEWATYRDTGSLMNPRLGILQDGAVDLWFGMKMEFDFYMPKDGKIDGKDMEFSFVGDDDVFVYIDDYLVLDIGGTHGPKEGKINFATGAVQDAPPPNNDSRGRKISDIFQGKSELKGDTFADYTKHKLKFFYLERGGNISSCKLKFNMPPLPDKSLTVTKKLAPSGNESIDNLIKDSTSYKFRVLRADAQGNPTSELYVKAGTAYSVLEDGVKKDTGTVDNEGYFYLKDGQSALFENMLSIGGDDQKPNYIVEEILPNEVTGQYGGVQYELSGQGGMVTTNPSRSESFTGYKTSSLSVYDPQIVTFFNQVDVSKLGELKITKEKAPWSVFEENKAFSIQVKLGDKLLAKGTKYQVKSDSSTLQPGVVETEGMIELKLGETAVISGILAGTVFEVSEPDSGKGEFNASYSGTIQNGEEAAVDLGKENVSSEGISGEFQLSSVVDITVTNASYDFVGTIPVYKKCFGLDVNDAPTFSFAIEEVKKEGEDWKTVENTSLLGTSIKVGQTGNGNEPVQGEFNIGYKMSDIPSEGSQSYFYKISEVSEAQDGNYIYDDTFYIVEVQVKKNSDGKPVAEFNQDNVLKNGKNPVSKGESILFTNYKKVDLTVSKTVAQAGTHEIDTGKAFGFTAVIKKGENVIILPNPKPDVSAGETKYSVGEDGTIRFTLKHGADITIPVPIGASVTVSENGYEGYYPSISYQVGEVNKKSIHGDTVTITETEIGRNAIRVDFTNTPGAILPDTGGPGLLMFNRYGWILLLMAMWMAGMEVQFYGERRKKVTEVQKEERREKQGPC